MIENQFYIQLIKETPTGSILEMDGEVSIEQAKELGIYQFNNFKPKSIGFKLVLDVHNRNILIRMFEKEHISNYFTHYSFYYEKKTIAQGYDQCEINTLDKNYYLKSYQEFVSELDISKTEIIPNTQPKLKKITFLNLEEKRETYSLDIKLEIESETMFLRFTISSKDYKNLIDLRTEMGDKAVIYFNGAYTSDKNTATCGLTIELEEKEIDLSTTVSKEFISNLLWFQKLEDNKLVEKLKITGYNKT